jgi:hypothetical protein
MKYLIKFFCVVTLISLLFLVNGQGYNKGLSAIENKIRATALKLDIKEIRMLSVTKKDSVKINIIYGEHKIETVFTKDEIKEARRGSFSVRTQKKIKGIFQLNNGLNLQPPGGGPIQKNGD